MADAGPPLAFHRDGETQGRHPSPHNDRKWDSRQPGQNMAAQDAVVSYRDPGVSALRFGKRFSSIRVGV